LVSLIQSNFHGFGSGVTVPQFGFGLQNRGSSFALEDGHANVYEPGKRPFHTIIPAFAIQPTEPSADAEPRVELGVQRAVGRGAERDVEPEALLSFGVMGAAMQPQGHVQVFTNMVDFGMNLQEAGDAPRVRHEGSTEPTGGPTMSDGGVVHLESGFTAAAVEGLRERGHTIAPGGRAGGGFGGYQAILRDLGRGVYLGASESRKDGHAAGY
jgi:gamma-glutamyltranspeptidase/glutathione hydrolase